MRTVFLSNSIILPPSKPSLTQRINTATRSHHISLNSLILFLLPLALPPHVRTPELYIYGMRRMHFIYATLENTLNALLAERQCASHQHYTNVSRRRRIEALRKLQWPALRRAERLGRDIEVLERIHCPDDRTMSRDTHGPALQTLNTRITNAATKNPHLLLAHLHLLYLALFNGGRYIRAELRDVGHEFYFPSQCERGGHLSIDEDALSFWNFEGGDGGEGAKQRFKASWEVVEGALSEGEMGEVVDEAVEVMRDLEDVVREAAEGVKRMRGEEKWMMGEVVMELLDMKSLLIKHVLPMGFVELIKGGVAIGGRVEAK